MAAALERAPLGLEAAEQVLQVGERARTPTAGTSRASARRFPPASSRRGRGATACSAARLRVSSSMSSSRPVNETGWNETALILSMFSMRELEDVADLVVVDGVDDRHHERDVDAGCVEVLDRAQLDVEEVADLAVLVVLVADAVELQVGEAQPGLGAPLARTPRPARSGSRWSRTAPRSSRSPARSGSPAGSGARASARRPRTARRAGGAA